MLNRKEFLHRAEECICVDREEQYGSPEDSFKLIAALWEPYIKEKCVGINVDVCITGEDVAVMMALLKIARIAGGRFKADSYVDAIGYMACAGEIAGKEG